MLVVLLIVHFYLSRHLSLSDLLCKCTSQFPPWGVHFCTWDLSHIMCACSQSATQCHCRRLRLSLWMQQSHGVIDACPHSGGCIVWKIVSWFFQQLIFPNAWPSSYSENTRNFWIIRFDIQNVWVLSICTSVAKFCSSPMLSHWRLFQVAILSWLPAESNHVLDSRS